MNALPEVMQAAGQLMTYVRLAVHLHESGLSWLAYNLTAVSPHNHWTGAGLQRLMSNPPISYDHWAHLPAWRVHRLVDARALGYVHDAHLAELAVVLVALARVWWLRRRRRALRRAAARAAGWPSPHGWGQAGGRGPAQPGSGSGLALAGVIGLARLAWLGVRLPFMVMGAAGALPALVAAPGSGTPAARSTAAKGKADKPLRALKRDGWLTADGWPVGTVGRGLGRRTVTLSQDNQVTHVMVSGSPGTGKSKSELLPWIFSEVRQPAARRASLVVMDPKPDSELTATTIGLMERAGWRVLVYDPFSPGSLRINVLGLCASPEAVKALVDAWCIGALQVDHPTIGKPAKGVLTALALHLRQQAGDDWAGVSLADVAAFMAEAGDAACVRLAGITEKAKGQNAMDSAREMVDGLLSPTVAASMAGQDWDAAAFVETATVLYVPICMGKRKSTAPFFVALFTTLFSELSRVSGGVPLRRRVRIIADEFANMSPVPGFSDFVSAVRYLNIGVAIASQGVNDIKSTYAATEWGRIEACIVTRIHLPRKQVGIIGQEGRAPIVVTTRVWMRGDRRLRRQVRRGQRSLDKRRALERQLRQQGLPLQLTAPAGPVALIEGPHDGDTRRLDTAVYTAITEPLAGTLPVELVEHEDSPGEGEGVDHGAMTAAVIGEEEETREEAAATARREAAERARERRQERASTVSTVSTTTLRPRRPYKTHPRICAWEPCSLPFRGRENAVYCSPNCRAKAHYAQRTQQDQTAV